MPQPICVTCSKRDRDCCHLRDDPAFKFGLTKADVKRLVKATGKEPVEFAEFERVPATALAQMESTYLGIGRMFPNGHRISLKFPEPDRACVFYRDGCTFKRSQRPRCCNIFPAWHVDGEAVWPRRNEGCMAIADTEAETAKAMGQTVEQIARYARLHDKELDEHSKLTLEEMREVMGQ